MHIINIYIYLHGKMRNKLKTYLNAYLNDNNEYFTE